MFCVKTRYANDQIYRYSRYAAGVLPAAVDIEFAIKTNPWLIEAEVWIRTFCNRLM